MKKKIILGICIVLLLVCGNSLNTYVGDNNQGFLGLKLPNTFKFIEIASAQEEDYSSAWDNVNVPNSKIWDIYNILDYGNEFKFVDKPLNEHIKTEKEVLEEFLENFWYDKEGYPNYKNVKMAPSDWAVLGATGFDDSGWGTPNLPIIPVDTDKDGKPEILMPAVTDYMLRNTDLGPIEENIVYYTLPTGSKNIKYKTYYILDPFHKPKNEDIPGILKLLYTNPDWKIVPLYGEDTVKLLYWEDLVGKTPAELGLDKEDKGIFGSTPSQTSSPAESTLSEVPEGEENGIPGFEALFAIMGLLVVAYVLGRRKK